MTNPSYLFQLTIGPVQSFIAQARKTRDLYGGSKLLSALIGFAIQQIEAKGKVIFPKQGKDTTIAISYPNRFIAKVQGTEDEIKDLGLKLEAEIQEEWLRIGEGFFTSFDAKILEVAQAQLRNHLEIYWVAVPVEENNYAEQFALLNQEMGARKNIRDFKQYNYQLNLGEPPVIEFGEQGKKCSLDGERNALVTGKEYRQFKKLNKIQPLAKEKLTHQTILPHEGLSAISFTKRSFATQSFLSPAGISLLDTLEKLKKEEELRPIIQELNKINEQLLAEDSLTNSVLKKLREDSDDDILSKYSDDEIRVKYQLVRAAGKAQGLNFTSYYAVLLFDGDSMGKWLSGDVEFLKSKDNLEAFHDDFSNALTDFAQKARSVLETHQGKRGETVYAGGDDFMGFINLNHLFDILIELRLLFRELVFLPLQAKNYLQAGREISFSAGVCIAPIKHPLRAVLEKVRHLEKKAKSEFKEEGKNAIAVGFIKGSGELQETVWRQYFEAEEGSKPRLIAKAFTTIYHYFSRGIFSEDLIRTLDREMLPLGKPEHSEIVEAEIKRLVYRKYKAKDQQRKEEHCEAMQKVLIELYQQNRNGWRNYLSALYMCSFLKDKLNYQTVSPTLVTL